MCVGSVSTSQCVDQMGIGGLLYTTVLVGVVYVCRECVYITVCGSNGDWKPTVPDYVGRCGTCVWGVCLHHSVLMKWRVEANCNRLCW